MTQQNIEEFNYGDIIEYIDSTRDLHFEAAHKWARTHNVTFNELIDKREERDDIFYRYFQIGCDFGAVEPTEEEIKAQKIMQLKRQLSLTDYAVIKIAEGAATKEEYAELIAQRQQWRQEINSLETE